MFGGGCRFFRGAGSLPQGFPAEGYIHPSQRLPAQIKWLPPRCHGIADHEAGEDQCAAGDGPPLWAFVPDEEGPEGDEDRFDEAHAGGLMAR